MRILPPLRGPYRISQGFSREHPGLDINTGGPCNADLGYPVQAIAEGVAVYAGDAGKAWGGIVLLHHPRLGIWSQYAHLLHIAIKAGEYVFPGEAIGSIGAGGWPCAHLHFEIRRVQLPADHWPRLPMDDLEAAAYLDPAAWLKEKASPTHRYYRPRGLIYAPSGSLQVASVVVNLDRPDLARIRYKLLD